MCVWQTAVRETGEVGRGPWNQCNIVPKCGALSGHGWTRRSQRISGRGAMSPESPWLFSGSEVFLRLPKPPPCPHLWFGLIREIQTPAGNHTEILKQRIRSDYQSHWLLSRLVSGCGGGGGDGVKRDVVSLSELIFECVFLESKVQNSLGNFWLWPPRVSLACSRESGLCPLWKCIIILRPERKTTKSSVCDVTHFFGRLKKKQNDSELESGAWKVLLWHSLWD